MVGGGQIMSYDKYEWMSRTDLLKECRKLYNEIIQLKKVIRLLEMEAGSK